jgi:hypothetical protein
MLFAHCWMESSLWIFSLGQFIWLHCDTENRSNVPFLGSSAPL